MSLTSHLADRDSPVRRFFADRFLDTKSARMACTVPPSGHLLVMRDLRSADVPRSGTWGAGEALVCPSEMAGFPWSTVGTAFDYQLRFLLGERKVAGLIAWHGAERLALFWGLRGRAPVAFSELVARLESLLAGDDWSLPASAEDRRELAQLSYVLALYEQCFRAPIDRKWPLLQLGKRATLRSVIGIVPDEATDDLDALIELFVSTQPELLDSTKRVLNPTFAASVLLGGADADLILDGRLLDVKTKLHGRISRVDLWQLLGYVLADFDDIYDIGEVGFYFSRQGIQVVWELGCLMELLAGAPQDLAVVRREFREMLDGMHEERLVRRRAQMVQISIGPAVSGRFPQLAPAYVRDRPSEEILRPLTFRPPASGKGKWHVTFAGNRYVRRPEDLVDPRTKPSCGARSVVLDRRSPPVVTERGKHRSDYPGYLCSRCLDMTGPHFYPVTHYKVSTPLQN